MATNVAPIDHQLRRAVDLLVRRAFPRALIVNRHLGWIVNTTHEWCAACNRDVVQQRDVSCTFGVCPDEKAPCGCKGIWANLEGAGCEAVAIAATSDGHLAFVAPIGGDAAACAAVRAVVVR
jgi:hypothetical protein